MAALNEQFHSDIIQYSDRIGGIIKYPKTLHLPDSPSREEFKPYTPYKFFEGSDLVITEKLDGANVGFDRKGLFSRSGSTPSHSQFDRLKALHGDIRWQLPDDIVFFGEWCEAIHHFKYRRLSALAVDRLFIFGIYEKVSKEFLSWSDTVYITNAMGLNHVPVVAYSDDYRSFLDLRENLGMLLDRSSSLGYDKEGLIVRKVAPFSIDDFSANVAKYSVNFAKGDVIEQGYERQP